MTEEMKSLEELQTVGSDADVQIEVAAPREPMRDALGRSYATGKRKDAVARVWIKPGSGKVVVNGKEMNAYFALLVRSKRVLFANSSLQKARKRTKHIQLINCL